MRFLTLLLLLVATTAPAQTFKPGEGVSDSNPTPMKVAAPARAPSIVASGTVTAAATYQLAVSANTLRKGCLIQNKSTAILRVFVGSAASATNATALDIPAGLTFSCSTAAGLVIIDDISVASDVAGSPYLVVRQ